MAKQLMDLKLDEEFELYVLLKEAKKTSRQKREKLHLVSFSGSFRSAARQVLGCIRSGYPAVFPRTRCLAQGEAGKLYECSTGENYGDALGKG